MALAWGVAGAAAGWFIPLIARKTAEYKLKKAGKTLPVDKRFSSLLLKLICLVVSGTLWATVGLLTANLFQAALLAVILLDAAVITVVDIKIHIIPNEAVLFMLLAGLLLQITSNGLEAIIAAVVSMLAVMIVFIMLGSILGFHTIGAGDVKLAGAMGLMLGYPYIMYALIGMSALFLVWCCGGLLARKLSLKSMFAFAPFMMGGTVLAIVAHISGFIKLL
jgi:Flp pilus assembly protein protease CpaA